MIPPDDRREPMPETRQIVADYLFIREQTNCNHEEAYELLQGAYAAQQFKIQENTHPPKRIDLSFSVEGLSIESSPVAEG